MSGFEVIRDLVVDHWALETKREISKPWMMSVTRKGLNTPQGAIGSMTPLIASELHSITDIHSYPILHQSNNIAAAKAVADSVRSTLGPKGMDKMLVDGMGDG